LFGVLSRESVIRFQSGTVLAEVEGDAVDSDSAQFVCQLPLDGFDEVRHTAAVLGRDFDRIVDSSRVVRLEQNP
jgi:hypothetical protein